MTPDTMHKELLDRRETLKNRCTLLAALILTVTACYLLVAPPV
jgi:hypothetical protein